MGQQIRGFPNFPKHSQTVVLGLKRYRVTFIWKQRAAAWYFDLHDADGNDIVLGRRMSAKAAPIAGIGLEVGVAPSHLFVRGIDGYQRDDLGSALMLVRYDLSEVAAPATATDLVVI